MVLRRTSKFLSLLTFFGLTPEDRFGLFKEIHEIVFHGKGGYDHDTVYDMPIWLRKFTYSELEKFYDKQNKKDTNPSSDGRTTYTPLDFIDPAAAKQAIHQAKK